MDGYAIETLHVRLDRVGVARRPLEGRGLSSWRTRAGC